MSWQFTPYAIPLIVAGVVSLAVAAAVWRRRSRSGAWPMLLLMLAGALWAFGNALELGSRVLGDKVFWANVEYIGIVLIPVFWFVFAEQYTDVGRTVRYREFAPLLIVPLVTVALVWSDPLHGLMRRNVRLDASGPVSLVAKEYGPWFWVHTAYSYLLLAAGTVLIVRVLFRSSHIYRGQAAALVTAALLPWLANGLYLAEPALTVRMDLTPVAFVCSGTICSWALLRYGLLDLVPAARQAVLRGMADGLLVLDAQRRLVDMNPAAERIARVTLADALGRSIDEVTPDDLMPELADTPTEAERFGTVDGRERWFDALASPLHDGRGRMTGWVLVLRDITERKRTEADRERLLDEVQRRAAELDATIASMAEGVAIHGPGGEIVRINPTAEQMMGLVIDGHRLAMASLLSRVSILQPDGQPFPPSQYPAARALRGETVRGALALLRDVQGEERWLSESAAPIRDVEGRVLGAVVTATDITERRRIEQELLRAREGLERRVAERTAALQQANEALHAEIAEGDRVRQALVLEHQAVDRQQRRLRAVLDILPVGVIVFERDGRVAEANTAAAAVWAGRLPYDEAGEAQPEEFGARWASTGAPVAAHEWPVRRALVGETVIGEEIDVVISGAPKTLLNYALPIRDEQEQLVGAVAMHVDITARKRAERDLQTLNEILEERVDQRTSELQASEARFRAIFEEAALGIALTDAEGRITETNVAMQAMLGYSAEELAGLEYEALFARHAAEEANAQAMAAQEAALYGELLSGARQSYRLERSLRHRDDRLLRVRVVVSLIREPAGAPRYAVRMLEDVTAQRETQAALLQAEKLAITGRLAASFAHEIGNPLQSILGVLSVVRAGVAGQEEPLRLLQVAEEELLRASNIVRQLRDLHRPSEPAERRPTDLRALLEASLLLTRRQAASQGVAVQLEVAEDLPQLPLARDQMQQVFLNLILNGIEAMPDGGTLRVHAVRTAGEDATAGGVRLDFIDTGPGIAPEDLPHLFESFYSTKPSGLGLGLYVSHGIVQQHGGHIAVESAPGQGATFSVWLPLRALEEEPPAAPGETQEDAETNDR